MSAEKSRPAGGGSRNSSAGTESTGIAFGPEETARALDFARDLVKAGMPAFVAPPCPSNCDRKGHTPGSGFHLPSGWETSTPTLDVIDQWRPGWALAVVGGHAADILDVDPRNGGDASADEVRAAGQWPRSFGQQATPSGGTHDLISATGERKLSDVLPGLDLQSGCPDGTGRGFAFISPTVRASKVDGVPRPYRWIVEPDTAALTEFRDADDSTAGIVARVHAKRMRKASTAPAGTGTAAGAPDVIRRVEQLRDELAAARDGANDLAARLAWNAGQYVGAGQVTTATATEIMLSALDGWTYQHPADEQKMRTTIRCQIEKGMSYPRAWEISRVADTSGQGGGGTLPNLPAEFWQARPVLEHIRKAAHSRARSADLVLFTVMARLSAMTHHELHFRTVLGDGSLNLFVAAVGPSGTGKSAGVKVAQNLLPLPRFLAEDDAFRDGVPIGSGEGLAEVYMGTVMVETDETYKSGPDKGQAKSKPARAQVRHNVFVYVDEGEALTKQTQRQGATIGPVIRQAWNGETLGQQNAREETTRILKAGNYSLGLVAGFQRSTALPVLADAGPGTPQRFLWCAATDPNVPERPVPHPGPLAIGDFGPLENHDLPGGLVPVPRRGVIEFPDEVNAELWSRNLSRVRGEVEDADLDSHISLMRCKVAALLALLDGRDSVNLDDWQLSQAIWDTSASLRDALVAYGRTEEARVAETRTQQRVELAYRSEAARMSAGSAVQRVARKVAEKVHAQGALTRGQVRRETASRDRDLLSDAIEYATAQQWIEVSEDDRTLAKGTTRPG